MHNPTQDTLGRKEAHLEELQKEVGMWLLGCAHSSHLHSYTAALGEDPDNPDAWATSS